MEAGLTGLLNELESPRCDLAAAETGGVRLINKGNSKGLTVHTAVVLGVEAGLVPFSRIADEAEERRLLYVAMTRATDMSLLTCAVRRTRPLARSGGGRTPLHRARSPPLAEISYAGPKHGGEFLRGLRGRRAPALLQRPPSPSPRHAAAQGGSSHPRREIEGRPFGVPVYAHAVGGGISLTFVSELVYLDTNAWNYLFGHPDHSHEALLRARSRLIQYVADNKVLPVASLPLYEEVIGAARHSPEKFQAMSELLFRVVERRWLVPLSDRWRQEAAMGGLLPPMERYLPRQVRRGLQKLSPPILAKIADNTYQQGKRFKAEQEEIREQMRRSLPEVLGNPALHINVVIDDWWREEMDIGSWVRDLVGETAVKGVIESSHPRAQLHELLPSAWHFMAYKLARIKRNLGEGRKITTSDYIDAEHYAAGPYVDVLVSDDAEFQRTCNDLPASSFRTHTFAELVNRLA